MTLRGGLPVTVERVVTGSNHSYERNLLLLDIPKLNSKIVITQPQVTVYILID